MTSSLNSMEVIKKPKNKKTHNKKIHDPNEYLHTTIQKFWLIHQIGNFPKEITNLIQPYEIPTNKNFEQDFRHVDVWRDFRIPLFYYYLLQSSQIKIIEKLFTSEPSWIPYQERVAIHYSLPSKEDYKEFLTLPIELRRYLTKLPQSAQNKLKLDGRTNPDNNINEHKIIRIRQKTTKPKLIIPEEKLKNIKLDVNR